MSKARAWAIALSLCGCDWVYGIGGTHLQPSIDARYFDAPIDTPFTCPPIGMTPQFSALLHQPVLQDCSEYTIGGRRAASMCNAAVPQISEGEIDGHLDFAPGLGPQPGPIFFDHPRLTPEGTELFARVDQPMGTTELRVFHADADSSTTSWTPSYTVTLPFVPNVDLRFGAPSGGPVRRMMVTMYSSLHELEIDASGNATDLRTFTSNDLGVVSLDIVANLSPDGLRMVFGAYVQNQATLVTLYTDRPTLDTPFRKADVIGDASGVLDPFLTADCARVYFSAVRSVMYIQQR